MNLAPHFGRALIELNDWRITHGEQPCGAAFYDHVEKALQAGSLLRESAQIYEHVRGLNWFICDASPLSKDFIPSFKTIFIGLHTLKQKAERAGAVSPCACVTSVTEAAAAPSAPKASRDP